MAYLPAPIARVRTALRDFLQRQRELGRLADGDLLLVGCSGGADSVALAAALAFLAPRTGLRGGLATVDHDLQPGSADRAARVVALGERLGLSPSGVWTAPDASAGLGPEGDARERRYAALFDALERTGARAILLAHTMEDQAETVLLGLSRGAGTRAVAGMPAVRQRFWRPLLSVRRSDTEAACAALELEVWDDPTNAPDGPWRTADGQALPRAALRHRVLPELGAALGQDPVPALARTAYLAREDSDFLEELARGHHHLIVRGPYPAEASDEAGASDAVPPDDDGGASDAVWSIDADALASLPPALRWRVLRELIVRSGVPAAQVSMTHVHGVDSLVTDWRGQRGISLPLDLRAQRTYGRLYVVPPPNLESA